MSDEHNDIKNTLVLIAQRLDQTKKPDPLDLFASVHPFYKIAVVAAGATLFVYNNFVRTETYKIDTQNVQNQITAVNVRLEKSNEEMRIYIDNKFRESTEHSDSNRKSMEQQLGLINDNIKTLLLEKEFLRRR